MHATQPHADNATKFDRSPHVAETYGVSSRARTETAPESVDYIRPWSVSEPSTGAAAQQRFVAGQTFFNYDAFGSLRPNEDPILLFSRQYVGLAIHVLLCGFSFYFFTYGYGRLLAAYLKANDDRQVKAANYMLIWPSALAVVIGLVSDLFTVMSYRRKAYMVIGWSICIVMCLVLAILDAYSNSGSLLYEAATRTSASSRGTDHEDASPYASAFIFVSLLGATGIQISWVAAIAASVEFAQREHVHHRGRLQATLLALYYLGAFLARSLAALTIDEGATSDARVISKISIGYAATILAVASSLALPSVLFFFREDPFVNTPCVGMSLKDRLRSFWKFCHHNVVYRVLFFAVMHLLLIGQFNQNVRDAVQLWSGVTKDAALTIDAARHVPNMIAVLTWKLLLRNVDWRVLVRWGSLLYVITFLVLNIVVTYDLIRNEWFYAVMIMISEFPRGWLLLFMFILATEIADVGHEGVTVGLTISFQSLAGLVNFTLASLYPSIVGFKVSDDDVKADSSATRSNVIKAVTIVTVFNFLCLAVIRLLPQQKLDAQQLRAFGGYNKYANTALAVVFGLLLAFNLASNLVVVM